MTEREATHTWIRVEVRSSHFPRIGRLSTNRSAFHDHLVTRAMSDSDPHAPLLTEERDSHPVVQTDRPRRHRVKVLRPVHRHDELHSAEVVDTVELTQQLHRCSLDLTVDKGAARGTLSADGALMRLNNSGFVKVIWMTSRICRICSYKQPTSLFDISARLS